MPIPKTEEIRFIDFSDYSHFFEECNSHFSIQKIFNIHNKEKYTQLYQKSIPNVIFIKDFNLLETNYFEKINLQTINFLKNNYENNNYSFVVLNLEYGIKKYIPFGYINKIQHKKIFIPTKQFKVLNLETSHYLETNEENKNILWDVELFLYNCKLLENFNNLKNEEFIWNNSFQINKKKVNFSFNYTKHFEKIKIFKMYDNIDLIAHCV